MNPLRLWFTKNADVGLVELKLDPPTYRVCNSDKTTWEGFIS